MSEELKVGSEVMRKTGDPAKGEIKRIFTGAYGKRQGVVIGEVAWPAPRRINGSGYHTSTIKLSSLIPYSEEEAAKRKVKKIAALLKKVSRSLPTLDDIRAKNPAANGFFVVEQDGSGFALFFMDRNGTSMHSPGLPVERLIKSYKSMPSEYLAKMDAIGWLDSNHSWL
jgi:hypothetical protein